MPGESGSEDQVNSNSILVFLEGQTPCNISRLLLAEECEEGLDSPGKLNPHCSFPLTHSSGDHMSLP